ncbi:MAG TPA: hypothetical protein VH478_04255 [Trebonia sp.]|nr:hypothetical protein [Trebonia sp.]
MSAPAARRGGEKAATVLAMQDELTALGLLAPGDGRPAAPVAPRIRATGRAPEQPCGTNAGATRHRRRREPMCEPCRVAERADNTRRRDQARARKQEAA